jgi:crossover junction endodeoxyribonuclease RuvC
MKVIAIDPGYDRLGVAVLEHNSPKESLIFSTCIQTDKSLSLSKRLHTIGREFEEIIKKHRPEAFAIETLFFNKNTTTAIGVAAARGVLMYLAEAYNCSVYEFSPQSIKVATTGYGNSDKSAVTMMVKRLVTNAPEKALDDEYDAIAVGVTCLATYGRNR